MSGADLLPVLVVQTGAVRCPVSSIAAGRHYIGLVKGEALYWQRETYALGSPFHITASQWWKLKAEGDKHTKHFTITLDASL